MPTVTDRSQPQWARDLDARMVRIEEKLDFLIGCLADEEEEEAFDLDGNPAGHERDPSEPLS